MSFANTEQQILDAFNLFFQTVYSKLFHFLKRNLSIFNLDLTFSWFVSNWDNKF